MKFLAVSLLALVAIASARHITLEDVIDHEENTVYGYLNRIGVPLAEKIRKAEEEGNQDLSRIVGGSFANNGQFPYQVTIRLSNKTPLKVPILLQKSYYMIPCA